MQMQLYKSSWWFLALLASCIVLSVNTANKQKLVVPKDGSGTWFFIVRTGGSRLRFSGFIEEVFVVQVHGEGLSMGGERLRVRAGARNKSPAPCQPVLSSCSLASNVSSHPTIVPMTIFFLNWWMCATGSLSTCPDLPCWAQLINQVSCFENHLCVPSVYRNCAESCSVKGYVKHFFELRRLNIKINLHLLTIQQVRAG